MADVFLTGGTGFVGSHVLRALLEAGHRVRCLVRRPAALPPGATAVEGDLLEPGRLVPALRGCDAVVHAAALYSFTPADRPLIRRVNVEGTAGLLEAARIARVPRAVVTSSSATTAPEHATASAYHESKLEQERAGLAARVPVVLLLPTAPIGPGDRRPTPTGRMVLDAMRGRLLAYPSGAMNVVPVEDVARAHVLALERGLPGGRYVLGAEDLSFRELFALAAEAAGRRPPRHRLPRLPAHALGRLDELRCRAGLGRQPAVPLEGVRLAFRDLRADPELSALAERDLGWRPEAGPREAVERAVAWFRSEGMAA